MSKQKRSYDGLKVAKQDFFAAKRMEDCMIVTAQQGSIIKLEEFSPILKYQGNSKDCMLNAFVGTIEVAIVAGEERIDSETAIPIYNQMIAVMENREGSLEQISNEMLEQFLIKKPSLFVTSQGLLLFYAFDECYATLDCNFGNFLNLGKNFAGKNSIKKIEERDGIITFFSDDSQWTNVKITQELLKGEFVVKIV